MWEMIIEKFQFLAFWIGSSLVNHNFFIYSYGCIFTSYEEYNTDFIIFKFIHINKCQMYWLFIICIIKFDVGTNMAKYFDVITTLLIHISTSSGSCAGARGVCKECNHIGPGAFELALGLKGKQIFKSSHRASQNLELSSRNYFLIFIYYWLLIIQRIPHY